MNTTSIGRKMRARVQGSLRERKDNNLYRQQCPNPRGNVSRLHHRAIFATCKKGGRKSVAQKMLTQPDLDCLVRRVQIAELFNKRVMEVVRHICVIFGQVCLRERVDRKIKELPFTVGADGRVGPTLRL